MVITVLPVKSSKENHCLIRFLVNFPSKSIPGMKFIFSLLFMTVSVFSVFNTSAQRKKSADAISSQANDPLETSVFNGLAFRSIGPALVSGRISDLAVNPRNIAEYYV